MVIHTNIKTDQTKKANSLDQDDLGVLPASPLQSEIANTVKFLASNMASRSRAGSPGVSQSFRLNQLIPHTNGEAKPLPVTQSPVGKSSSHLFYHAIKQGRHHVIEALLQDATANLALQDGFSLAVAHSQLDIVYLFLQSAKLSETDIVGGLGLVPEMGLFNAANTLLGEQDQQQHQERLQIVYLAAIALNNQAVLDCFIREKIKSDFKQVINLAIHFSRIQFIGQLIQCNWFSVDDLKFEVKSATNKQSVQFFDWAVENKNDDLVIALMNKGLCHVDNPDLNYVMQLAARQGNTMALFDLLNSKSPSHVNLANTIEKAAEVAANAGRFEVFPVFLSSAFALSYGGCLQAAVEFERPEFVVYLAHEGVLSFADMNVHVNYDASTLSLIGWAVQVNNLELVQLLTPFVMSEHDLQDAFEAAVCLGRSQIVASFLQNKRIQPEGDDNWAICSAAEFGQVELIRLLLEDGRADPAFQDNMPLFLACRENHFDTVGLLLNDARVDPSRAGVSLEDRIHDRQSVIATAAMHGYVALTKRLLSDPRLQTITDHLEAILVARQSDFLILASEIQSDLAILVNNKLIALIQVWHQVGLPNEQICDLIRSFEPELFMALTIDVEDESSKLSRVANHIQLIRNRLAT